MFRTVATLRSLVRLTALAGILTLVCQPANAQYRPFFVAGSGSTPIGVSLSGDDSPHNASGFGFPTGPYTGDQGNFKSLSFDPETLSGTFKGSFVFVDFFGDELFCTYGDPCNKGDDPCNGAKQNGTYQLYDAGDGKVFAVFLAEFNPDPEKSTGRFKRAVEGSLIMLAISEPFPFVVDEKGFSPPWDYTWFGKGWLRFR